MQNHTKCFKTENAENNIFGIWVRPVSCAGHRHNAMKSIYAETLPCHLSSFTAGMGYVLSQDLVRFVMGTQGIHWRLHHPEDGTVPTWWAGHVLNRITTTRFHDRYFFDYAM